MTPEGQFSGESAYSAANGKVSIYGEVSIEYIGNEKSDGSLNIGMSVDYDGYIFNGSDVDMGCCVSVDGKWSYSGSMNFEPLSSNTTRILRYCVEVPEYDKNVGVYTFTFGDTTVEAVLPYMYDSNYQYNFSGIYEVFSGTILLS